MLQAYRGNGAVRGRSHLPFISGPGHAIDASPIIADMNGDGHNDVGVGNDFGLLRRRRPQRQRSVRGATRSSSYEAAGAVGNFGSARLAPHRLRLRHAEQHEPHPGVPDPAAGTDAAVADVPSHGDARRRAASGGNPLAPGHCRAVVEPARTSHPRSVAPRGYWFLGTTARSTPSAARRSSASVPGQLNGAAAVGMQASPSRQRLLDPHQPRRDVHLR